MASEQVRVSQSDGLARVRCRTKSKRRRKNDAALTRWKWKCIFIFMIIMTASTKRFFVEGRGNSAEFSVYVYAYTK